MSQGLAFYPGIKQPISAQYTYREGITPEAVYFTIAPQSLSLADTGTVTFTFDSVQIELIDCKPDKVEFTAGSSGQLWTLPIFDRRWKWKFPVISGVYNVHRDDGQVIPETERTPVELCEILLDAMGESGWDLSEVPTLLRPAVEWTVTSAAQALADLADSIGCFIVPRLDAIGGKLCRIGVGADLPNDDFVMEDSLTYDPPELPDEIGVVCAPTRYQEDFRLEAVGYDVDARGIKLIKKLDDLSYRPAGGWSVQDPVYFGSIPNKDDRDLAMESVFRLYRVICDGQNPLTITGFVDENTGQPIPITDRRLLVFEDEQVESKLEGPEPIDQNNQQAEQVRKNLPADLFGVFYERKPMKAVNNCDDIDLEAGGINEPIVLTLEANGKPADKQRIKGGWSFDTRAGIVKFSEPVYRHVKTDAERKSAQAAVLVLRTAVSIRHHETRALSRYELRRQNQGRLTGTKPRLVLRDDITFSVYPTYAANYVRLGITTNQTTVDREANYQLDSLAQEYQLQSPRTRRYAGLHSMQQIDGAITQITWSVGGPAATTQISRNNLIPHVGIGRTERRRIERLRQIEEIRKNRPGTFLGNRADEYSASEY